MNEFWRQNKSGIISGIVASAIFLYFLQPLLELASRVFFRASNFIGSAYVDRIYAQAAHLETQDFSFTIFIIYFGGMAAIILSISIRLILKSLITKSNKNENDKDSEKTKTPSPSRLVSAGLGGALLCVSLFLFSLIAADFTQLSTISSFKQHMRIIAPYVDEQKEEELLSQWSLMENQDDYNNLYLIVHAIAEKDGLKLPENRIYSPLTI